MRVAPSRAVRASRSDQSHAAWHRHAHARHPDRSTLCAGVGAAFGLVLGFVGVALALSCGWCIGKPPAAKGDAPTATGYLIGLMGWIAFCGW